MPNQEKKVFAFTGREETKIHQTISQLCMAQLGVVIEHFTSQELQELFVPPEYRNALCTVYQLEITERAWGTIFLLLPHLVDNVISVFDEAVITEMTLKIHFDRTVFHDGFVTPQTLFGTKAAPMVLLQPTVPEDLRRRFLDMARTMMIINAEWAVVRYVFKTLNAQLRTPQQVRYVWPGIYTLCSQAKLAVAETIIEASSRAGINASTPSAIRNYLRPTYEVIVRSVLLKRQDEYYKLYEKGHYKLVNGVVNIGGVVEHAAE